MIQYYFWFYIVFWDLRFYCLQDGKLIWLYFVYSFYDFREYNIGRIKKITFHKMFVSHVFFYIFAKPLEKLRN